MTARAGDIGYEAVAVLPYGCGVIEPETRYARSGDVNIAYQVVGDGPRDVLFVPGWVSHLEYGWEEPRYAAFLKRLASFSRLILLDRRGTGMSDSIGGRMPTLEERMDDVRAVLDAVGSERATVMGVSEGGPMCALFAATYPERTEGLILAATLASSTWAEDYTWAPTAEELEGGLDAVEQNWGTGFTVPVFAPSLIGDEAAQRSWARFERRAVSPGGIRKLITLLFETDVRGILSAIRVPTLVMHRTGDRPVRVEGGRYLAEHIAGARYVELEGEDHFIWTENSDAFLDEIEEFLTGARGAAEPDRVLATVMFSDVVDSTQRAVELGDRRWSEELQGFYRTMRGHLRRFRGREIDTAGDGLFASFDGPARAIRCAVTARNAIAERGLAVRIGLHTGECEVIGDKIGGVAVHLGARVAGQAAPGEVLVSSTVKDLVAGSGLGFSDRGVHTLKGIPGDWQLFAAAL